MDGSNFDDLAKRLAATASRKEALRLVGGTLAAGALSALLPGRTSAAGRGNSACAHFCSAVFGEDTPAAGQCTREAAYGGGLCYTCGPASAGGGVVPSSICCAKNGGGYCASYSGAACCTSGLVCHGGTCVTPAVCSNPTTDICFASASCGPTGTCACVQSVEGGVYCSAFNGTCASCASDADCVAQFGQVRPICTTASCCPNNTACVPATCG